MLTESKAKKEPSLYCCRLDILQFEIIDINQMASSGRPKGQSSGGTVEALQCAELLSSHERDDKLEAGRLQTQTPTLR